jgi:FKBP-type peptidyl-prolyl cis-trans isomerase SlyD
MAGVEPGHIAIVHLTGRLVDSEAGEAGEVFETTDVDVALESGVYHNHRDFKPLEFRVGEGKVLPGIDAAVQGMTQGETKTVTLEPEEAYGPVDEDDVVTFPREKLETGGDGLEVGELVRSERGDTGWVTDVSDEGVTVDFNHELAGERVEFEIRLLEVHATKTGKGPA